MGHEVRTEAHSTMRVGFWLLAGLCAFGLGTCSYNKTVDATAKTNALACEARLDRCVASTSTKAPNVCEAEKTHAKNLEHSWRGRANIACVALGCAPPQ